MKSIKEEIKQEKFASNYEMVMINLIYTTNYFNNIGAKVFKKYGLLRQHYNVLRIVGGRRGKSITPGEILDVMLDKGRDLTRLVDKLTKLDLLTRSKDPKNKRRVNISLTKKGKKTLNEINKELTSVFYKKQNLTEKESETLSSLLDKMRG